MRKFSNQRGPKPAQNATQLVRAYFGLTQQDLATLMGVSRAAVAMDERWERSLPWPQAKLLAELSLLLPAPDGPAPVPPVAETVLTDEDRDVLDLRRQAIALEAHPLRKKLERCEVKLAQARLWQQALPALRVAFATEPARVQRWLSFFEEEAAATLREESGQPAQLRLRLSVLDFETAAINQLLGEDATEAK